MNNPARGLSLIEMLVVLSILAVTAGMVVSMTDNFDQRTRYQESAARLAEIRSAVLGPDAISADGMYLAGGYLQDTGSLPTSGGDLLRCPDALKSFMQSSGTHEIFQYNSAWHTWYGWRGPYVNTPALRKGETTLTALPYDGWGNAFAGWSANADGNYVVQSLGADGVAGGTGIYDRDLPDSTQPLLRASETRSPDLSGRLQITVVNLLNVDLPTLPVRCRIVAPAWNGSGDPLAAGTIEAVQNNPQFSAAVSLPYLKSVEYSPQNRTTLLFKTEANGGVGTILPAGRRTLILTDTSGVPLQELVTSGGATIRVSAFAELYLSRKLSPSSATIFIQERVP